MVGGGRKFPTASLLDAGPELQAGVVVSLTYFPSLTSPGNPLCDWYYSRTAG